MLLIVGLGNPGDGYARHRHNIGFMALDAIAAEWRFSPWRQRFHGRTADGTIDGRKVVLLKPETFMNDSGRSVGEAQRFLKIETADIVVVHDELDLAPGVVKAKTGGGHAGHNGLRSITQHIGAEFHRVRIGIGHPGHKDLVSGYVLHDFARADREWIEPTLAAIAAAAPHLAAADHGRFLSAVALARGGGSGRSATAAAVVAADPPRRRSAGPHPAGERAAKRQTALAENLKKWLGAGGSRGKAGGEDGDDR